MRARPPGACRRADRWKPGSAASPTASTASARFGSLWTRAPRNRSRAIGSRLSADGGGGDGVWRPVHHPGRRRALRTKRRKPDPARIGRTAGTPGAVVAWSQSWRAIEPRSSRMDERRAVSSAERVSARRRRASTQYHGATGKTARFECIWCDSTPPTARSCILENGMTLKI